MHKYIIDILTQEGEPSHEQKSQLRDYFSDKKDTHFSSDIGNEIYQWYLFLKDLLEKTSSYNEYSYLFILEMFIDFLVNNYQEVTNIDLRIQDRSSIGQFFKISDNYTVLFSAAMITQEANTELAKNNFKALLRAVNIACVDKNARGPEILLKCILKLNNMSAHDMAIGEKLLMENMVSLKNCDIRNTSENSEVFDVSNEFEYDRGSAYLVTSQTTMKYNTSPLKGFPLFTPDKVIQDKKDSPDLTIEKEYRGSILFGNYYRQCKVFSTWNVDERGRPYFTEKISEVGCDVSMMTIGVLSDSNISLLTNESSHYFYRWQKCLSPEFVEELRQEFGHLFI